MSQSRKPRTSNGAPADDVPNNPVAANHYHNLTFLSWRIALDLTASFGEELCWVMSDASTYPDPVRSRLITPLTRGVFRRLARTYGFTSMPPMPTRPLEVAARARAAREALTYVRRARRPVLRLVPEGSDSPDGSRMRPPVGVGRFLLLLTRAGLVVQPAGVYEEHGRLRLRWGAPIRPLPVGRGNAEERERLAADAVMQAIATGLPSSLRGRCA